MQTFLTCSLQHPLCDAVAFPRRRKREQECHDAFFMRRDMLHDLPRLRQSDFPLP